MCHSSNCGGHFFGRKTAAKNFQTCISCQSIGNMSKKDEMPMSNILEINEVGRRIVSGGCHPVERKTATLRLSGGCHPTERHWMEQSPLACTTTPCPTASWPPVTWKGGGAHVPLSVQAKPLEPLLTATPRLCFRPACRPDWLAGPLFCNIFIFISCSSFISKVRL
ncbi:unnamed protein product [Spirodela intermedia]|uniref:Uncharacterized protein n=1 Tax=Spirodela intermedia TaxID=51605 RepID=A0A7I8KW88_SPIIN|nr:unnamed protein product [Spirodela intermedia]